MSYTEEINNSCAEYLPINKGLYQLLSENCVGNGECPALSYFGKVYTFSQLMKNIDRAAAALTAMGIKKGDTVIVSLPSVPEAVELFYAVNKIGAIFCGMDCRSTADEIKEIIAQVKPKACFVSDFHLKQFREIEDIPIICITFMKTISAISAFASVFVGIFTGRSLLIAQKSNFLSYGKFLSKGKEKTVPAAVVKGEDIAAYFYTSGTTYGRKCVVLTNENMNASVMQYARTQPGIDETDRFCTIMPLFTCYGITLGTHLPLILGKQVRMIPLFTGKRMKNLLISERPGYITTVPAHWEHFMKDDFEGVDLSFFKGAIVGGDKLSSTGEEKINEILKKCKSPAKVMRGYGLTEAATAVTAQLPGTPVGSVGKTLCWEKIGIFEPDTDIALPNGTSGEICVCGPNICCGYLDDEEATNKLLKKHSDGNVWMHSGDIGYLDENDFLFFCERKKRIFVRFDGTKISPYGIEQQLYKCPVVSRALVYPVPDKHHDHGQSPAAMIVLKDEYEKSEAKEILNSFISAKISYHLRPTELSFVDFLPVTRNGKFDYFRPVHSN
ncbi:MAG: acyl--CoA ligase [Clostridia bacterium]|nr:acyl--CoA ligase [Clostridia bacterium]